MISFTSFADEFIKIAQGAVPEEVQERPPHPALIAGAGLGGLGLGFAAGHATTHGINKLLKMRKGGTGGGIPPSVFKAAPVMLGLTGLGVGAHQAYTWDKARKAMEERSKQDGSYDS